MIKFNKKRLSEFLIIIFAVLLVWSAFLLIDYFAQLASIKTVTLNGQKIEVAIAKTDQEKVIGLSQRESLSANTGMLFVYDQYLIPSFWMKDMKFPLDIIWIKDNMVVGYNKDLQPIAGNFNLPIYQPKTFVNYVLEVKAGAVDQYGIRIGDEVKIDI